MRIEDDTNVTHARFQVTVMTAHCAAPESQNAQSRKRQEAERKKGANINHKLEAAAAAAAEMEATQNEAHTHTLDHAAALRMRNSLAQSGSQTS